ncbi:MAG: NADH-quinone oxidoreductase subunit C [Spiribacter sp.]|jgi:NADH-quinone oxidoreductase subunit C|nr:NADH-quinone oxidoreductase subunit C [Spiribacter sp.]MDR9489562.1 NADH-quinone oxidoreductase subunit C [Spiribacter sp.]
MPRSVEKLLEQVQAVLGENMTASRCEFDEVEIEVAPAALYSVMQQLRDAATLGFDQLLDIAGVDYGAYGSDEWTTDEATNTGFSRGVDGFSVGRLGLTGIYGLQPIETSTGRRFAAVYHLLSVAQNQRLRVRCFAADDDLPMLDSIVPLWASANWQEREAFDLYGIMFNGHPDLRRILTDYGFVGHPFRKDFPVIGNVEVRYDENRGRVVYEPVSIEPRVLVPRVIRDDNRYTDPASAAAAAAAAAKEESPDA